ncbi:hypothetical protein D3C87_1172740 [compost metagenome]
MTAQKACQEGDAEIDEHALGDIQHGDVHREALQTEQGRQHCNEQPGHEAVGEDLETAVEGHQTRTVLLAAAAEIVPHQHHGDAARQAYQDEAHHVARLIMQKHQGDDEHQYRAHQPVHHQGEGDGAAIPGHGAHGAVIHLGERRVHHQDEAYGQRHVGGSDRHRLVPLGHLGEQIANPHPNRHGDEDPEGEIAVEKTHFFADGQIAAGCCTHHETP